MEQSLNYDISTLLKATLKHDASDLHLVARSEPQIRIDGVLVKLNLPVLEKREIDRLCYTLLTDKQKKILEEERELDFSIDLEDIGRFRVNYYYTMGSVAAAFRVITTKIPTLEGINAPSILKSLVTRRKGLILVTGPTGSGKTTTVAAMINEINQTQKKHILCIEDPIEYVHKGINSLFSYRNVGEDTKTFNNALKSALREDPDIIFIGEMRNTETMEIALEAAETGHLVIGTLHTNSAAQTINRIVSSFEGAKQDQVRSQVAITIEGIISQVLLPRVEGGRVAATEVLIGTPAIRNLIRENKVHQINSQMTIGQTLTEMKTMAQSLDSLYQDRIISKEEYNIAIATL
ncbi:type IV pilus twitching motility protein PilT [Helicobacter sp. MIT 99-5507]|uniref:type IV pilus twitching motility protein PilT n=1 Tax=Helicobacter sp. MIT 99-5507 TaxID=152489 RepID=UPI000E1E3A14|nr:type IV pilus twitching motility protein PilT [Helicobacter sp. MIT 99-5507]RDU56564.1 type IV pili twitching motility protein PilT [Helicobacter sp. MIT 99-5507]